ncbi:hypothetical protein UY3_10146 [Chelonia mydas]|uniref:Uncharacterized protein n=1 Tax=Chelonia mydas TaxID=8469 RepID=M7BX97_CHEMY|nr:hypothetical protein UY3_10146 [Chelonia mydas]
MLAIVVSWLLIKRRRNTLTRDGNLDLNEYHRTTEIDKEKEKTVYDMFQKILQASAASENECRAWKITLTDSKEKDRVERGKEQEKERDEQ